MLKDAYSIPFEARIYQSYLSGIKNHWRTSLYQQVIKEVSNLQTTNIDEIESSMLSSPSYQLYAWQERMTQQFKYIGRGGIKTILEKSRKELLDILQSAGQVNPERLKLNPSCELPDYVGGFDVHQVPGGLGKDALNTWLMVWYQKGLTFAGGNPDALVEWYADHIVKLAKDANANASKVLDLGCTLGRSTMAIKKKMPNAEVFGCDVCEYPLRYGHLFAIENGIDITLCQENAEKLTFKDKTFDIVASHWLFHELPSDAIVNVIHEAARVLNSGGIFVIYDMCKVPGGPIGEWLHKGMAIRNNEPYALSLIHTDLEKIMKEAGFKNIQFKTTSPDWPEESEPSELMKSRYMFMNMYSGIIQKI